MDPDHRFDQPSFSGGLYTLDRMHSAAFTSSTKYQDIFFPARQPIPPELWRHGGIIHDWGNHSPQIVVVGSSHALMFSKLIDDICKQLGLSVAFLCMDGTSVFFPANVNESLPTAALAQSFDEARKRFIRIWRPDAVLVIDRWDSYAAEPARFSQKLGALAGELAPFTRNVIVFSQIPVMRLGNTLNLREYVNWHIRTVGRLPTIQPDYKEPFRQSSLGVIAALAHTLPNVQLLQVERPFYEQDGSVRYAIGRNFLYADDDHLTDAGAELSREMCSRAIVAATASTR